MSYRCVSCLLIQSQQYPATNRAMTVKKRRISFPFRTTTLPILCILDPDHRPTVPRDGFVLAVVPHIPVAWIDEMKSITGCEIPFTRHFHH